MWTGQEELSTAILVATAKNKMIFLKLWLETSNFWMKNQHTINILMETDKSNEPIQKRKSAHLQISKATFLMIISGSLYLLGN